MNPFALAAHLAFHVVANWNSRLEVRERRDGDVHEMLCE